MSDLPEPWATWATRAGVRGSMTGIGEVAGVPASTVSRLIQTGRSSDATVKAVAAALRVSEADILTGTEDASRLGPWSPPLEAHLLTEREREALGVLIQGLTEHRKGGQSDAGQAEAEKSVTETPADEGNVVEGNFPLNPDGTVDVDALRGSKAARTLGEPSRGERIREQLNKIGEEPDPEAPED